MHFGADPEERQAARANAISKQLTLRKMLDEQVEQNNSSRAGAGAGDDDLGRVSPAKKGSAKAAALLRKRQQAEAEAAANGSSFFDSFGKGGGGAPLMDAQGGTIANLKQVLHGTTSPVEHQINQLSPGRLRQQQQQSFRHHQHQPSQHNSPPAQQQLFQHTGGPTHVPGLGTPVRAGGGGRNGNNSGGGAPFVSQASPYGQDEAGSALHTAQPGAAGPHMAALATMNGPSAQERAARRRKEEEYRANLQAQIEERRQKKEFEEMKREQEKREELVEYCQANNLPIPHDVLARPLLKKPHSNNVPQQQVGTAGAGTGAAHSHHQLNVGAAAHGGGGGSSADVHEAVGRLDTSPLRSPAGRDSHDRGDSGPPGESLMGLLNRSQRNGSHDDGGGRRSIPGLEDHVPPGAARAAAAPAAAAAPTATALGIDGTPSSLSHDELSKLCGYLLREQQDLRAKVEEQSGTIDRLHDKSHATRHRGNDMDNGQDDYDRAGARRELPDISTRQRNNRARQAEARARRRGTQDSGDMLRTQSQQDVRTNAAHRRRARGRDSYDNEEEENESDNSRMRRGGGGGGRHSGQAGDRRRPLGGGGGGGGGSRRPVSMQATGSRAAMKERAAAAVAARAKAKKGSGVAFGSGIPTNRMSKLDKAQEDERRRGAAGADRGRRARSNPRGGGGGVGNGAARSPIARQQHSRPKHQQQQQLSPDRDMGRGGNGERGFGVLARGGGGGGGTRRGGVGSGSPMIVVHGDEIPVSPRSSPRHRGAGFQRHSPRSPRSPRGGHSNAVGTPTRVSVGELRGTSQFLAEDQLDKLLTNARGAVGVES